MSKKPKHRLTKEAKFSLLFDKHYSRLLNYSIKIVTDINISEELVQETFIKLWEHFENVNKLDRSIESFLIITLKNKIIDNYRKNQTRDKHNNLYNLNTDIQIRIDNQWELLQQIDVIYETLQEKTIEIFKLSRDKGMTYKEISVLKNISIKTVELHISKALIAFRKGLKDYF